MDGTGKQTRWPMVKLGDVCATSAGGTPLKVNKDYYNNPTIPWLLSGEINQKEITKSQQFISISGIQNSSAKIFPINTILIAMYGATAGQVGILRFESSTNQAICGIYPNEHYIPEFLYYCIYSKREYYLSVATGNAQPNISQEKIRNTLIPLPPLAEQQRIVARLDAAFAAIDEASAAAASNARNARALFESYLDQVFNQRGAGWVERRLGEVCSYKSGGTPSKQVQTYWNGNIPWVSAKDLKTDEIFDAQLHISEEAVNNSSTTIANRNSILILVRGMGLANGVPLAITRKDVAFNQDIKMLACTDHSITIDFLFIALKYALATTKILSVAGHGTLKIDTDELLSTSVLYPPSDVQATIVNQYSELKHQTTQLTTIYERKVAALAELKQSLLAEVFGA